MNRLLLLQTLRRGHWTLLVALLTVVLAAALGEPEFEDDDGRGGRLRRSSSAGPRASPSPSPTRKSWSFGHND